MGHTDGTGSFAKDEGILPAFFFRTITGAMIMTELSRKTAETAVAENYVMAGWQQDVFAVGEPKVDAPAYSSRKIRMLGGMQLSGSGNYCASMDLIHQHVLRAC